jgi:Cell Wall Hydrolase
VHRLGKLGIVRTRQSLWNIVNVPVWNTLEDGGEIVHHFGYARRSMTARPSLSAHQRFAMRARARAARRARRMRLAGVLLLPVALLSCVADGGTRVASIAAPTAAAPSYAGIPVIAGTPVAATEPAPVADLAPVAPTGPSFVAALGQRDRMRATLCLASAIYYEAATEPDEGQRAVAQVVLNRVRHREWPQTICGVVYQGSDQPGCQFSFACDGAMARGPMLGAWIRARRVAERALAGEVYAPVGSATFYHTMQVAPAWGRRMTPVAIVGAHIFYRMPGDAPEASSLPMLYAGREPTPGPLPRVAPPAQLMAVGVPVPVAAVTPVVPVAVGAVAAAAPTPTVTYSRVAPSQDKRYVPGALPDSTIREEFRDSGKWIAR